jgi:hypothetical protein
MSDQHLDLDALADVLAGEPSAHLDGCADCRAALAELEAAIAPVSASLLLLGESPIPADVVARLDAALAAEHAPVSPASGEAGPVQRPAAATVTPLAARRVRWLPAAAGVAAAAALVVGAVVLVPHLDLGGGSSATSASPKGIEAAARIPSSTTGSDYSKEGTLLKQNLPSLLAGGGPKAQSGVNPQAPTTTDAKVDSLSALATLREPGPLASCLASLTDANDPGVPLALDYASFEGQPALVVVLPTTQPDSVDVFVVGAGCSQADAKVLFFTKLAKPS